MAGKNYTDLVAWQKAMDLVERIYEMTKQFPKEETYSLTAQLRRSAVSIPSNIAEGQGRKSSGEFCRFLNISHGSLRELETQVMIAGRLSFLRQSEVQELLNRCSEVGRVINGLLRSFRTEQT